MKLLFQQADLDTCLTALLLGVTDGDEIVCRRGEATPEELADPIILCIEAGGSGQVHLKNFDHHNTTEPLPPACVQAYRLQGGDAQVHRLVDYVAHIDQNSTTLPPITGLTLSGLFSGMRLVIRDPKQQLMTGIALLRTVLAEGIDPFGIMRERPEWHQYIAAKKDNMQGLAEVKDKSRIFTSQGGLMVGYVETVFIGALGALYEMGCHVGIALHPCFGDPPVPKYTIGSNNIRVDALLPALNAQEQGWGGPASGTIIGSPRSGSQLTPAQVTALVQETL
jgi:hypothetical protein